MMKKSRKTEKAQNQGLKVTKINKGKTGDKKKQCPWLYGGATLMHGDTKLEKAMLGEG